MSKFLVRTLSGAIYVALVVFALYASRIFDDSLVGYMFFTLMFCFVAITGVGEYYTMLTRKGKNVSIIYGVIIAFATYWVFTLSHLYFDVNQAFLILCPLWASMFLRQLWHKDPEPIASIGYTLLPILWVVAPIVMMQTVGNQSIGLLMTIFICTWANDTGAYLTGMALGKHPFWVRHSPKKTWEGTIGGAIVCILCAIFVGPLLADGLAWWYWGIIGIICGICGTLGDLVESMFKRSCGVKDSGKIMPGHGGILDRFDSILMIMPFITALLTIGKMI